MKTFALFIVVLLASLPSSLYSKSDINFKILKGLEGPGVGLASLGENGVILAGRRLIVFESKSGKEISSYQFGISERPMRLDVIDIDHDGVAELAVTSALRGSLSSYIFSAIPKITLLQNRLPYFFRTLLIDGKSTLVGQKSLKEIPYAGAIYRLSFNNGKINRGEKLAVPKGSAIYSFSSPADGKWGRVWIRDASSYLKLYEKEGKKWKVIYKTTEKYPDNVNCFYFSKDWVMTQHKREPLCVPTPPAAISFKEAEYLLVDREQFLLGGVILDPSVPRRAYLDLLKYDDSEGMSRCMEWGPYQGWIGDIIPANSQKLTLIINSNNKYKGGIKIRNFDISSIDSIDCKGEM